MGAALDFAIEFVPAFSKVISPMAFALFLRIGSPGEHGILLYNKMIPLYQGECDWPGISDNNTPEDLGKNMILMIISVADDFRGVPFSHQTICKLISSIILFSGGG